MMMKTLRVISALVLLALPAILTAATNEDIEAVLDMPVPRYSNDAPQPLRPVLEGIGKSYGVPIVLQPSIEGDSMLNVTNTTVRDLLTMLCKPNGYFWELDSGYIYVRKTKTVLYVVDYPQNTRSSQDSASVTLGGTSGGSYGGTNGAGGVVSAPTQTVGPNGGTGTTGGGTDSTQVSVTGENKIEFWDKLEAELKARAQKDESVLVNKFAGLVEVDAGLNTHARIGAFLAKLNRRIGRQIRLQAKIVSVTIGDQSKLGVDWDVAAFHLGNQGHVGGGFTNADGSTFSGLKSATLGGVSTIADQTLPAASFTGTIGAGKVNLLIQALKQQGTVRSASAPQISALNNQTAYIKVAEERTFWQNSNTTQVYGSTGNLGTSTPVVVGNYTPRSLSIGNFLKVVAQVDDAANSADATITLDVLPVLTRLQGQDISPDGKSNSPNLSVQQASTMVRIRNGESAVIGGFQTWTKGDEHRAIPVLGSLPVLGRAFRTDGKTEQLTELAIIITATVVEPGTSKPLEIDDVLRNEMRGSPVASELSTPVVKVSKAPPAQTVITPVADNAPATVPVKAKAAPQSQVISIPE